MSIQAMKMALEALGNLNGVCTGSCEPMTIWVEDEIEALRAAIEAAERQELVAWEGAKEWEQLAYELCAEEHGEEYCNDLLWSGGVIPEPWGDRWLKYEDEAKRMISLVRKFTAPQPAIPPGMVLAKVANLIACRDALVDKDRDEAYHQLYTSCDWTDPYSPWAEWEAVLNAAPKPGEKK